MPDDRPDFDALARQFVYDEVTAAALDASIPWVPLMNCFDAWLDYHGVSLDQNRSVRSHRLVEAMADAGLPRTGGKGRFKVRAARLYVGTPAEFLADIAECAEADGVALSVSV